MKFKAYRKWDVVWVDFPDVNGCELAGLHPAIVVSHNVICNTSTVITVLGGSSVLEGKEKLIGQYVVPACEMLGLVEDTRFDTARPISVDIKRVRYSSGTLVNTAYLEELEKVFAYIFEMEPMHRSFIPLTAYKENKVKKKYAFKIKAPQGFHFVVCYSCNSKFVFNNRNGSGEAHCKNCGTDIPLKSTRIEMTCPDCGRKLYGHTNLSENSKSKSFNCECKKRIPIRWDAEASTYRSA